MKKFTNTLMLDTQMKYLIIQRMYYCLHDQSTNLTFKMAYRPLYVQIKYRIKSISTHRINQSYRPYCIYHLNSAWNSPRFFRLIQDCREIYNINK